jgi:hypothetical protein
MNMLGWSVEGKDLKQEVAMITNSQFDLWQQNNGQKQLYLLNFYPKHTGPFYVGGERYYLVPEDALQLAIDATKPSEHTEHGGQIKLDTELGTVFITKLVEDMPPEAFPYFFGQQGNITPSFWVIWVTDKYRNDVFRGPVAWDDFKTKLPGEGHQNFKMAPYCGWETAVNA